MVENQPFLDIDPAYEAYLDHLRDLDPPEPGYARQDAILEQKQGAILTPFGLTEAEMAQLRSHGPYIWVTLLPKLLAGENPANGLLGSKRST